jgi:hypothetical protein
MESDSEDEQQDLDRELELLANKQGYTPQAIPVIRREQASYHYKGHVKGSLNVLYDETKIKKKVFLPSENNFNYSGLIIGPKGANQKWLEEKTGCKIIIRGRGALKEGQRSERDDWEPLHVLVAGDKEELVNWTCKILIKLIKTDI